MVDQDIFVESNHFLTCTGALVAHRTDTILVAGPGCVERAVQAEADKAQRAFELTGGRVAVVGRHNLARLVSGWACAGCRSGIPNDAWLPPRCSPPPPPPPPPTRLDLRASSKPTTSRPQQRCHWDPRRRCRRSDRLATRSSSAELAARSSAPTENRRGLHPVTCRGVDPQSREAGLHPRRRRPDRPARCHRVPARPRTAATHQP